MLATAADIVAYPSAPDAFVNGIMEGVDWVWEAGLLKAREAKLVVVESTPEPVAVKEPEEVVEQAIEKAKESINKTVDPLELEEKKLEIFQNFLSNL